MTAEDIDIVHLGRNVGLYHAPPQTYVRGIPQPYAKTSGHTPQG